MFRLNPIHGTRPLCGRIIRSKACLCQVARRFISKWLYLDRRHPSSPEWEPTLYLVLLFINTMTHRAHPSPGAPGHALPRGEGRNHKANQPLSLWERVAHKGRVRGCPEPQQIRHRNSEIPELSKPVHKFADVFSPADADLYAAPDENVGAGSAPWRAKECSPSGREPWEAAPESLHSGFAATSYGAAKRRQTCPDKVGSRRTPRPSFPASQQHTYTTKIKFSFGASNGLRSFRDFAPKKWPLHPAAAIP